MATVYDDEKNPDTSDLSDQRLREITDISPDEESKMDKRAHKGAEEDKDGKDGVGAKDLDKAEKAGAGGGSGGNDQASSLFNAKDDVSRRGFLKYGGKQLIGKIKNNKKAAAGGGIGAGIIGILIFLFLSLLPLKIVHIIENLQNRFYATSENAVQKETENMLSNYLKIGAKQCKSSIITKDCSPSYTGTSPISNLYKVWHANKLENVMAEKYGIEVKYNSLGSGQYYLKAPGLSGDTAVSGDGDIFVKASKSEVRAAVDEAVSNETRWKQTMYRFKIGRMLEEKYGIKRCVTQIGCHISDTITDTLAKPKRAAEVYFAERVLLPRSQILGQVLMCLADTTNCEPNSAKSVPCETGNDCELNGAAETKSDTATRTALDKLVAKFVGDDAYQIYTSISEDENGLTGYLVKQIASYAAEQFGGEEAGQAASNAVDEALPVFGWVNLAANVIGHLEKIGPVVQKLQYATNAASYVQMYSLYRTYADQVKSGHVDPTEVGSFNSALGPGPHTDNVNAQGVDEHEIGGTASAEASPIYDSVINDGAPTSTAFLQDLLPGKALAASDVSDVSNDYKCSDGKPPAGGTVCSEENLAGGNALLSGISNAFSTGSALGGVVTLANIWNSTVGKGLSLVGDLISDIPGFSSISGTLSGIVANIAKPVITKIVDYLIPNPFGADMSGARTFDVLAGGADVSGNDYAHHGLGGQQLSAAQTAEIVNEQQQTAQTQFKQESLFARVFDKDNQYSLVSRMAMAVPFSTSNAVSSGVGSLLNNPFSRLFSSFASLFTSGRAFAAAATPDPFGVAQYGYPDSAIPEDPDAFWNANCQDGAYTQAWNDASTTDINPNTGNPENSGTDACLLIQAAVGSAGGFYSDSVLTPDDLADSNGAGTTINTPSATGAIYMIGDSISVGMRDSGGLPQKLTAAGLNLTDNPLDATVGINVANSIPKLQADATAVGQAKTVVVELGTNDCSLYVATPSCTSTASFETQISAMVGAIRSINPNAQIEWVNIYTTKGPVYQSINQAITAESGPLNYHVIDWASEAINNPSKYSFDNGSGGAGVHQTTAQGWSNMADFIVGAL